MFPNSSWVSFLRKSLTIIFFDTPKIDILYHVFMKCEVTMGFSINLELANVFGQGECMEIWLGGNDNEMKYTGRACKLQVKPAVASQNQDYTWLAISQES